MTATTAFVDSLTPTRTTTSSNANVNSTTTSLSSSSVVVRVSGSSASTGLPLGAIIGIAIGGAVLLAALVALLVCVVVRRRRARDKAPSAGALPTERTDATAVGKSEYGRVDQGDVRPLATRLKHACACVCAVAGFQSSRVDDGNCECFGECVPN